MNISKRNANYIVQEISKIIGEKINMMNADGIIIASSDEKRVGSFHAAAKELIDQRLQEVIVKSDSEYEGARPGLNLAINFQDEIVGVIGVTGPYETVAKYGHIIKKCGNDDRIIRWFICFSRSDPAYSRSDSCSKYPGSRR